MYSIDNNELNSARAEKLVAGGNAVDDEMIHVGIDLLGGDKVWRRGNGRTT